MAMLRSRSECKISTEKLESEIRKFKKQERNESNKKMIESWEEKITAIKTNNPGFAPIYIIQGMLLERLNENEKASDYFSLAREFWPNYWRAYAYEISVHVRLGDYIRSKDLLCEVANKVVEKKINFTARQEKQFVELIEKVGATKEINNLYTELKKSHPKQSSVIQLVKNNQVNNNNKAKVKHLPKKEFKIEKRITESKTSKITLCADGFFYRTKKGPNSHANEHDRVNSQKKC